jgi:hypothetical protein
MHSPIAALQAIKRAVRAGSWRPDPHLLKQIARRSIAVVDVLEAIRTATRIRPHDMRPLNAGGESWRVSGCDADGRRLGIGVELVVDEHGHFVVIITAFVEEKRP